MRWDIWKNAQTTKADENQAQSSAVLAHDPTTWFATPIIVPVLALTSASLIIFHLYRRNLRRYATIDHLPAALYSDKVNRGLIGHVTSVGDGDNFRFFHTPGGRLAGWGWLRRVPTDKKDLRGQTIHVRIAGVDAPELAHFGKPAQPYGQEALDWLREYLLGRRVRVYIHSRDRFDRVVANPKIRRLPFFWVQRDVGVEQIKAGLATVFRQGGAEYGGLKEVMERAEQRAKKAKLGMWVRGKSLETPAEYKRRTKGEDHQDTSTTIKPTAPRVKHSGDGTFQKSLSWMRWAFGR